MTLGYFLGERWKAVEKDLERYFGTLTVAAAILIAGFWIWRKWRARRL
jgi:membrane protein DedA with SNARE-associated domain